MSKTVFLILTSLVLPVLVSAQVIEIQNPLKAESFEEIIDNIIDFLFNIALVLTPLMIVWAAFLFVTSGGNADQINQARRIIFYTLAGFAVILLAKGIVAVIEQLLGVK